MPSSDRDDRGRFTRDHSDREILDAVREHEPAATTEVADAVECTRQAAAYRLKGLESDWKVRSKKVGPVRVWTPGPVGPDESGDAPEPLDEEYFEKLSERMREHTERIDELGPTIGHTPDYKDGSEYLTER